MNIQPLLTQPEFDKLYPQEEYRTDLSLILHFLIARNQPEDTVLAQIAKRKQLVAHSDPKRDGLTPFIIAVMQGKIKYVQAMIGINAAAVNVCDAHQWSPLLHASISSKAIYDLLLASGAQQKTVIPIPFLHQLSERAVEPWTLQYVKVLTEDRGLIPLKDFGVERLGLACYRDCNYYPEGRLQQLWRQPTTLEDRGLQSKFVAMRQNPVALVIAPCLELEGKTSLKYELRAGQDIGKGQVIIEYTGEIVPPQQGYPPDTLDHLLKASQESHYKVGPVECTKMGNAARFANWGWPNAALDPVVVDGVKRQVLVAIAPIKKGEAIQFDYSIRSLHFSLCQKAPILGRDAMHAFYQRGIDHYVRALPHYQLTESLYIDSVPSCLNFTKAFPGAMLDLHYRNLVKLENWVQLLMPEAYHIGQYEEWLLITMIMRIIFFESELSNTLKGSIRDFVLPKIGDLTVLQILHILSMLEHNIIELKTVTSKNIAPFLTELETAVRQIDPQSLPNDWLSEEMVRDIKLDFISSGKVQHNLPKSLEVARKLGHPDSHEEIKDILWLMDELNPKQKGNRH